jgi:hypothetical protein
MANAAQAALVIGPEAMSYATSGAILLVLALLVARPVAAMEGSQTEFPEYDLAAACAKFGDLAARTCARDENEARDASRYLWPDLPSDLQTHCLIAAKLIAGAPFQSFQYRSLHNCLEEMAYDQHQYAGEIPLSIRKKWLDNDIQALKVGHY